MNDLEPLDRDDCDDPVGALDRVLALGASPWRRWLSAPLAAGVWSAAALVLIATPRTSGAADVDPAVASLAMVQVEPPPDPEPPPPPEDVPVAVAPPLIGMPATPVGPPSPVPIAEASAVETAPEDDNPYDDDDVMVVGTAETYAGGVSGANGSPGGPGGGYGGNGGAKAAPPPPPPPPPEVDHTRPARCRIDVDWGCERINTHEGALTIVRLLIRSTGTVEDVEVVTAPDGAFKREAVACARRQSCEAARDRWGRAVAGWTNPIRIRFTY